MKLALALLAFWTVGALANGLQECLGIEACKRCLMMCTAQSSCPIQLLQSGICSMNDPNLADCMGRCQAAGAISEEVTKRAPAPSTDAPLAQQAVQATQASEKCQSYAQPNGRLYQRCLQRPGESFVAPNALDPNSKGTQVTVNQAAPAVGAAAQAALVAKQEAAEAQAKADIVFREMEVLGNKSEAALRESEIGSAKAQVERKAALEESLISIDANDREVARARQENKEIYENAQKSIDANARAVERADAERKSAGFGGY